MDSSSQLKPRHAGAAFIAERIAEIASSLPELEELSPEAATQIMRLAVVDELKDQVRRRVAAERLDWKAERATFISDKVSQRTRVVYDRALALLEAWMTTHKLTPSDLTPREADDFIRELRGRQGGQGKPPDADTVRLVVSVCSSFFTFLERRDATIRNPFRGTKIRPRSTWPVATIPTREELAILVTEAHPVLAAALAVAAETGLRVGALPALSIREEGRYPVFLIRLVGFGAFGIAGVRGRRRQRVGRASGKKEQLLGGRKASLHFLCLCSALFTFVRADFSLSFQRDVSAASHSVQ